MKAALFRLGLQAYEPVLNLQRKWFEEAMQQRSQGQAPANRLIMVEHKPVYTFGKHAQQGNMLASPEMLQKLGADVFEIERGGDVTFHGPGQLVVYPMFDLELLNMGVKRFVEALEQSIMDCVALFGIKAGVVQGRTGVWVEAGSPSERKIAAIGIRCSRHYAMHGLALNVHTDLNWFSHIVPCGIADRGVTGISEEAGRGVSIKEAEEAMLQCLQAYFPFNFVEQDLILNS
ncbi:MAG: lipoyl(octanoyl) transferase LipB [Bacteroidetes bacterium]|nr:lipoyl(octanoyl) transferase LipB [Bacteroidota bacterium]